MCVCVSCSDESQSHIESHAQSAERRSAVAQTLNGSHYISCEMIARCRRKLLDGEYPDNTPHPMHTQTNTPFISPPPLQHSTKERTRVHVSSDDVRGFPDNMIAPISMYIHTYIPFAIMRHTVFHGGAPAGSLADVAALCERLTVANAFHSYHTVAMNSRGSAGVSYCRRQCFWTFEYPPIDKCRSRPTRGTRKLCAE